MSDDRITPYDEKYSVEERIDEIIATSADIHIEMLDEDVAFMQVGEDRFTIFVKGKKLFIAWRESDSDERDAAIRHPSLVPHP